MVSQFFFTATHRCVPCVVHLLAELDSSRQCASFVNVGVPLNEDGMRCLTLIERMHVEMQDQVCFQRRLRCWETQHSCSSLTGNPNNWSLERLLNVSTLFAQRDLSMRPTTLDIQKAFFALWLLEHDSASERQQVLDLLGNSFALSRDLSQTWQLVAKRLRSDLDVTGRPLKEDSYVCDGSTEAKMVHLFNKNKTLWPHVSQRAWFTLPFLGAEKLVDKVRIDSEGVPQLTKHGADFIVRERR